MIKQELTLVATGLILGGLPKDLNGLAYANEQRKKDIEAPPVKPEEIGLNENAEEEQKVLSENVFRRNSEGTLCVDEHVIAAMFREAVWAMESAKTFKGLWKRLHTSPYLIPFTYKPEDVTKEVRAFSVTDLKGRRSVVNIHEAIIKPSLSFTLELHSGKKYEMEQVLNHYRYAGRYIGLGAGRGKSGLEYNYGLFEIEVGKMTEQPLI
jgi:hypothetical protein